MELFKKKNRKHSKIDSLSPDLKDAVEQMLLAGATYSDVVRFLAENGVGLSISSVHRYAQNFQASLETLQIAQENFRSMLKEAERYPELDTTEVLVRIASQQLLNALISRPETDWAQVDIDKIVQQITGLTRAAAYKQRIEIQNKDITSAALDEVKAEVFTAFGQDRPDLYKQVASYLDKKKGVKS